MNGLKTLSRMERTLVWTLFGMALLPAVHAYFQRNASLPAARNQATLPAAPRPMTGRKANLIALNAPRVQFATTRDTDADAPVIARIDVRPAVVMPDNIASINENEALAAWFALTPVREQWRGGRGGIPEWQTWAQLPATRVSASVLLPPTVPTDALATYAARTPEGITVALANRSERALIADTGILLPRGVYGVERLVLTPSATTAAHPTETLPAVQTDAPLPDANAPSPVIRWERLEGSNQGAERTLRKRFTLAPGQCCLYRYLERARSARLAWSDTYRALNRLAVSNPGPVRRLREMLREGNSYISGVQAGGSVNRRLGCIHRLLLLTAQAQSLHHNFLNRATVDATVGGPLMTTLDRLASALSETSATLLGLVPQCSVTNRSMNPSKSTASLNAPESSVTARTVVVALANTGAQSVRDVKLGLDSSLLPQGVVCESAESAYFDVLRPGQTARVEFVLRSRTPGNAALAFARCVGDVSYFTAGTPAHLRPAAW